MRKIDWCEGRLKLAYIENKNVGENNLDTTDRKHLYKRGNRIQENLRNNISI